MRQVRRLLDLARLHRPSRLARVARHPNRPSRMRTAAEPRLPINRARMTTWILRRNEQGTSPTLQYRETHLDHRRRLTELLSDTKTGGVDQRAQYVVGRFKGGLGAMPLSYAAGLFKT